METLTINGIAYEAKEFDMSRWPNLQREGYVRVTGLRGPRGAFYERYEMKSGYWRVADKNSRTIAEGYMK